MTGSFKELLIINYLIIIHELGHTLFAVLFGIEIDKIYIYPLGGIVKNKMPLNISPIKELIILIMGPVFQFIAFFSLVIIFIENI